MRKKDLMISNKKPEETNIFSDKSALILDWLLRNGIKKNKISLREVARDLEVSIGLVQRVFSHLVKKGFLQVQGIRTAKKFFFKKPKLLLQSWIKNYDILKKCKMWTYHTGFSEKEELLEAIKRSDLDKNVVLALHSAAEALKCKNTSLNTLELYMLDTGIRSDLEKILLLEPQDRGYEVLLIKPYYKSLLDIGSRQNKGRRICPILLTYLDLYHFPLRGREQAEFMAERLPVVRNVYQDSRK
jgi:DNA-binding transcriptional regulator YhcF (GntR family)